MEKGGIGDTTRKLANLDALGLYKLAFDVSLMAKLISDENSRIIKANPAAENLFGQTLTGLNEFDLVWPNDAPILEEQTELRKKGESSKYQIGWKRSDGSRIFTRVLAVPQMDQSGAFIGSFGEIEDLDRKTERILAQKSREMCHEINNYLTGSLGYVDLLLHSNEEISNPTTLRERLRYIYEGLDRAVRIMNKQQSFNRVISGELSKIDLGKVIDDTLFLISNAKWMKGYQIEKNLRSMMVVGDKDGLSDVIVNLVKNGVEAMKGVGSRNKVLVGNQANESYGEFYVEDQGCGIPPGMEKKIFMENFTTKIHENGQGVGLYLVSKYMEKMSGYIKLDWSGLDQGSRFVGGLRLVRIGKY